MGVQADWSGRRDSNPCPSSWQGDGIRASSVAPSVDVGPVRPFVQEVQPLLPRSRRVTKGRSAPRARRVAAVERQNEANGRSSARTRSRLPSRSRASSSPFEATKEGIDCSIDGGRRLNARLTPRDGYSDREGQNTRHPSTEGAASVRRSLWCRSSVQMTRCAAKP